MPPIRPAPPAVLAHALAFSPSLPLSPRPPRTSLSSLRPAARARARARAPPRLRASAAPPPRPPTLLEMTPGTPELRARAAASAAAHPASVLSPLRASSFASADGVTVVDVRTEAQAAAHEINGVAGVAVRWSVRRSLDDMVSGAAPLPRGRVLLYCSRGPKALVALDYLLGAMPAFGSQVFAVEGGVEAWDGAGLPIVRIK